MKKIYALTILLVSFAFAQSYLSDEQTNAFQVTVGYKNFNYIASSTYQNLNIDYLYKGQFSAGIDLSCANLSEHAISVVGYFPKLYVYRINGDFAYSIIEQDNGKIPLNMSLVADMGTVYQYFYNSFTGAPNKEFYNNFGIGLTLASKTCFHKISEDLFGGISLNIMAKRFLNVPEEFYQYFIGYENTLYYQMTVDVRFKRVIASFFTERYKPLEFIFKQHPLKVTTGGINVSFLFPMNPN